MVPEKGLILQIGRCGIGQPLNALQSSALSQIEPMPYLGMVARDLKFHYGGMNTDKTQNGHRCQYHHTDN